MAIEEPSYQVLASYPDFELRRYSPYLVVETRIDGEFDAVGNIGFRRLADYIFGNNASRTRMEMTAPVSQRRADESAQSADPVPQASESNRDAYWLSFVVPSRLSADTVPDPRDERIVVREVRAGTVAARRYSGRWSRQNYLRNLAVLEEALGRHGLRAISEPVYARYNSPFSLWFRRRNEILIAVEDPPTEGHE